MRRILFLVLLFLLAPVVPVGAQIHDPEAPCGRDENGVPYGCDRDSAANLEAACLTRADPAICLGYHYRACAMQGMQLACSLYSLGSNCQGGDPGMCQHYVNLLAANRSCVLDGDPAACTWLRQALGG
ncbi:hypothetical protein [Histidinibacterium lentulum]|uniref:Sel1 repeat family protein n=1 Tax=Histidinibacterium lentulum TaxID=2480588 RepID=A0A3N2R5E0_9RHOB|nr:hypothetical protein [Histidinibacterium lentulum]ROU02715.1 hypothetical protein EAT49_10370 [Histidinibacterium lentulum]